MTPIEARQREIAAKHGIRFAGPSQPLSFTATALKATAAEDEHARTMTRLNKWKLSKSQPPGWLLYPPLSCRLMLI